MLTATGRDDDEEQFEKELGAVRSIQHENIVEFVGYCNAHVLSSTVLSDGSPVYEKIRALCFKYMEKRSLKNHATAGGGSRCAEIQGLRRASAAMLGF